MLFLFLLSTQALIPAALFPEVLFPPVLFSAALFILSLIILLVILLAIPVHLNLDISKRGPLMRGRYRIAWLGLSLRKREITPQTAADLLASISKKDDAVDESEGKVVRTEENGYSENGYSEEGKSNGEKKTGDSRDEEKSDIKGSPGPKSLLAAAPAVAHLFVDLFKSVVFQKLSCRLRFGLNDPAETAVISGYLWSVASTLGLFRTNVFIEPFFEGERLEGEFAAELKFRLFSIVRAGINALREKEIRSLIREVAGWN